MIHFDDLHKSLTRKIYVPVIGDVMVTRWSYEAIMVEQFRNNKFEKPFFEYDMEISQSDWTASFLVPALKVKADECRAAGKEKVYRENSEDNLKKLRYHITELTAESGLKPGKWFDKLNYDEFNEMTWNSSKLFLDSLLTFFRGKSRVYNLKRDSVYNNLKRQMGDERLSRLRDEHYNEYIANVVLNRFSTLKIYDSDHKLIQKADPAFMKPGSRYGRAHYYAPYKQLGNLKIGTLIFNTIVVWLMIVFLYLALHFDYLKRFVNYLDNVDFPFSAKLRKIFLPSR